MPLCRIQGVHSLQPLRTTGCLQLLLSAFPDCGSILFSSLSHFTSQHPGLRSASVTSQRSSLHCSVQQSGNTLSTQHMIFSTSKEQCTCFFKIVLDNDGWNTLLHIKEGQEPLCPYSSPFIIFWLALSENKFKKQDRELKYIEFLSVLQILWESQKWGQMLRLSQ